MGVKAIFKLIPTPWLISLALILITVLGAACGLSAWRGYSAGYGKAQALGRAQLAELRGEHEAAFAAALAELGREISAQARRALKAEQEHNREKERSRNAEIARKKEIAAVTAGSSHTFSPAFVRLWNEAVGAPAPGDALPGTYDSAVASGAAPAGAASDAGLLPGVSEADILAYINYYGGRCQRLEGQLTLLINQIPGQIPGQVEEAK